MITQVSNTDHHDCSMCDREPPEYLIQIAGPRYPKENVLVCSRCVIQLGQEMATFLATSAHLPKRTA